MFPTFLLIILRVLNYFNYLVYFFPVRARMLNRKKHFLLHFYISLIKNCHCLSTMFCILCRFSSNEEHFFDRSHLDGLPWATASFPGTTLIQPYNTIDYIAGKLYPECGIPSLAQFTIDLPTISSHLHWQVARVTQQNILWNGNGTLSISSSNKREVYFVLELLTNTNAELFSHGRCIAMNLYLYTGPWYHCAI